MGTNFYWLESGEHIGKRSAAGHYCWDCDQTLCMGGNDAIHAGGAQWYTSCPRCGGRAAKSGTLDRGPVAVELGFARPETARPSGVTGAASFTWAQDPEVVAVRCRAPGDAAIIRDEYDRPLTGTEFIGMLRCNCPIQFVDMIGREFS